GPAAGRATDLGRLPADGPRGPVRGRRGGPAGDEGGVAVRGQEQGAEDAPGRGPATPGGLTAGAGMSDCLSREQLRRLLDGEPHDGAAEHVEGCPACQRAVDQLTDGRVGRDEGWGRKDGGGVQAIPSDPSSPTPHPSSPILPPPAPRPSREEPGEEFLRRLERECLDTSRVAGPLVSDPAALPDTPPARVGGYRIVRLIGRGGMGAVYEAEQNNPRRPVALKMIRPGLASPDLVKRFAREAQVLGRLHH